jgi:hypothetical protein
MLLIILIALRVRIILERKNESSATVSVSLITFASPKTFTVLGMFWNAFRCPSFVLKQSACRMLIPRCITDKRTTYFPANTGCYDKEKNYKPLMK